MMLPGALEARYTIRGFWAALIGLVILALVAFVAIQTARLEGLRIWPIAIEGQRPRADRLAARIVAIETAQNLAKQMARQEKEANEAEYRTIAANVDRDAKVDLVVEMDAAERYIAAHGVRWQWPEGNRREHPGTPTGSDRAEDPQGTRRTAELDGPEAVRSPPASRMVLVSEADIRICTANTVKAEAGHRFALDVEAASRAPVD